MEEKIIKRPLVFAAGGMVLGEVLALYRIEEVAVLAIILSVLVRILRKENRILRVWVLFLFMAVGYFRMGSAVNSSGQQLSLGKGMEGRYVQVTGRVLRIEEKNGACTVTTDRNILTDKEKNLQMNRLVISIDEALAPKFFNGNIKIGMRIAIGGQLKPHGLPRNPGEFHYRNYYRALKSDYRMYGETVEILDETHTPFNHFLYRMKLKGTEILKRSATPEDAGVFAAAILGDKGALDSNIRDLYQKNGIAHLLAISGLHVSLIGLCIYRCLRRIGLGFLAAGLTGGLLLIVYGLLTGSPASVVRAVMMLLCGFLADYLGRTYDLLSAASLSLILILIDSPYYLLQGGVQLSFGAVFAIGGLGRWLTCRLKPSGNLGKTLLISISIQLITYPIILYHFYQYPIYGIVLNLFAIPLMAYVVISGILCIILGSFSVRLGIAAAGSGHYILRFYSFLCTLFTRLPGYNLVCGQPSFTQMILYYAFLFGIWTFFHVKRDKSRNNKWGFAGLAAVVLVCFILLQPAPVRGLKVTFLDVGQGDGIVLQTGKQVILIDGGSSSEKQLGKYRLEPFLKSQGISTINLAIVSHGDSDHISGLVYLLEESRDISIEKLILPYLGREEEIHRELRELVTSKGGNTYDMKQGDHIAVKELMLSCLYPGARDEAGDRNEQSLVIKADYGGLHLLFTGDMSENGEQKLLQSGEKNSMKGIQILKAAHHGSQTASSDEFLEWISPKWAVLSYGAGNSYGHPHKSVVERMESNRISLWETAKSGAVILKTDGKTLIWKEFYRPVDQVDAESD